MKGKYDCGFDENWEIEQSYLGKECNSDKCSLDENVGTDDGKNMDVDDVAIMS